MNLTRFAENLLDALSEPVVDPDNWMERLENVLYALEHGTERPPEMYWDVMQREAAMEDEDVEYSDRVLLNPISRCPRDIKNQKKRLEKEIIYHLKSLESMISWEQLKDGEDPITGWPDPWGIFEKCKDFAERIAEEEAPPGISAPPVVGDFAEKIAEEMGAPSETSAPPLVEESAERIAETMEAPSETSAPPVAGESAEGIDQGTQDCEAGEKIFGIDCVAIQKAFTSEQGFASTIRTRLQQGRKRKGKPNVSPIGKGKSESNQPTDVYDYQVVANILWDEYQSKAKGSLDTKEKIQESLTKACRDFTVS
jgi:hypothetical protein